MASRTVATAANGQDTASECRSGEYQHHQH
jgi:hypothetical protein